MQVSKPIPRKLQIPKGYKVCPEGMKLHTALLSFQGFAKCSYEAAVNNLTKRINQD